MKEAAAMYQAIDSKADLADVLMRLSRVAKKRGDLRGAERYAARAYEITKPVGTTVEG